MAAKQRTAIVTGAGKRVGAAIARALVADGWTVVAHVRREDDVVPDGAVRAVADLEQADCAERIFAAARGLAPVTLLVNNAARFAHDSFDVVSASECEAHMAVNVRAPLLLSAALATQAPPDDALIVNILDAKLAAPNRDYLSYTLSKYALAGLTELAARAFAPRRIRVNALAPALMLRSAGQSDANFSGMHANNPLGRGVTPDDVIAALRYLIGATSVTGQILTIDSGQRFMALDRDVQFLETR